MIANEKYITASVCYVIVLEASLGKVFCKKTTWTASMQELMQKWEGLAQAEKADTDV